MAKINELPPLERPREKAKRYGIESLSDYELLALLINCGTPENSAIDIAYQMLSDSHGLTRLVNKPLSDLKNYKGIGSDKAIRIMGCFELAKRINHQGINEEIINSSEQVYERYKTLFSYTQKEYVYLVILDKKKKVLHEVNLYKGTSDSVTCSSLEIIQQVIIHNGRYFYLLHNHPSGEPFPSNADLAFTGDLIKECKKFQINMLDHLIISPKGYFSFLKKENPQELPF